MSTPAVPDPRRMSTSELLAKVIEERQGCLPVRLARLVLRADKVVRLHRERSPRLTALAAAIHDLADVLSPHLDYEEGALFPALAEGRAISPGIAYELLDLQRDHLQLAGLLERIRDTSDHFAVPDWGCRKYRALVSDLAELDRELRAHIQLQDHHPFARFLGPEGAGVGVARSRQP